MTSVSDRDRPGKPFVLVAALACAGLAGLASVPIARSSPEVLHPAAPL